MCTVVGENVYGHRRNLKVTSWLQVAEGLAEDVVVVADETFELAAVDEVEGLVVGPDLLEVVDLETAVRGYPVRRQCALYCIIVKRTMRAG